MKLLRNNRGDTIMEVLIAIAILSLILTISFALTNRNTQGNRQAQERSEGVKYTESQIELLKTYLAKDENPELPPDGSKFCMNKLDGEPTEEISGNIPDDINGSGVDFATVFEAFEDEELASCKDGDFYYSYIERDGNTYTAHTRWYKVNGEGVDESTMVHRIHPDLASVQEGETTGLECGPNERLPGFTGCEPCPDGWGSPGGVNPICQPVSATIQVNVEKIRPNSNNTTPVCSSSNTFDKSGISVRLTGAGDNLPGTTNNLSNAIFNGLELNTDYTATVTAPSNHQVCYKGNPVGGAGGSASGTIRSGGFGSAPGEGSQVNNTDFRIRPVCETRYTAPYYHTQYWVDQGFWHEHLQQVYYWAHTGPDWYYGGPNPYAQWENSLFGWGPVYVLYQWPGPPANESWRNRYERWWYWAHAGWHWHPNWVLIQTDYYGDPYRWCPPN